MEISGKGSIVPIGTQFANVAATANVVKQLVDPSTNQYGLIIRTLGTSGASNTVGVAIFTDTSAPASHSDGTKRLLFQASGNPSDHLPSQVYLPAGYGIWMVINGNGSANLTYDLLDRLPTGL